MKSRMKILIAGRNAAEVHALENALGKHPSLAVSKRLITNGHADPLHNVLELPDTLIFSTTSAWEEELKSLGERPPLERPPTLIIGKDGNPAVMRMAMRIGARDYFTSPAPAAELVEALQRIERELRANPAQEADAARLVAVMNAKGGSGASTLAANLAHGIVDRIGQRAALVDMDLQFGTLSSLFDLPPADGLVDAINRVDSIDALALEGHMLKHKSGLHLLGNTPDQLIVPGEVDEKRLGRLVEVLRSSYDHVVVDLPRQIDGLTGLVLEAADRVLLVVQQSVSHVRDAKQLIRFLTHYLGVPEHQVTLVINRWDKRAPLTAGDIEKALGVKDLLCLPNDFARVAESANLGVPLLEAAPASPVSRAVVRLSEILSGKKAARDESGLGKVFRKWARA